MYWSLTFSKAHLNLASSFECSHVVAKNGTVVYMQVIICRYYYNNTLFISRRPTSLHLQEEMKWLHRGRPWLLFGLILHACWRCQSTVLLLPLSKEGLFEMKILISNNVIISLSKGYSIYGLCVAIIYLALVLLRCQTIGLTTRISF